MKYLLALFYIGFCLPLFDLSRRRLQVMFTDDETSYDFSDKKRSQKRVQRKYHKGKRKHREKFKQRHHFRLKGSHAKDHRFSNGNKLRRMFINM